MSIHRLTPGVPCHFVDRDWRHSGAVIAKVHPASEEMEEGTCDLIEWDPVTLCPQPRRLVPYRGATQSEWDGTDMRWSWHWIEET